MCIVSPPAAVTVVKVLEQGRTSVPNDGEEFSAIALLLTTSYQLKDSRENVPISISVAAATLVLQLYLSRNWYSWVDCSALVREDQ